MTVLYKSLKNYISVATVVILMAILPLILATCTQSNEPKRYEQKKLFNIDVVDLLKHYDTEAVKRLLGPPDSAQEGGDSLYWYYNDMEIVGSSSGIKHNHIQIVFEKGRYKDKDGEGMFVRAINYSGRR